MKLLAITLIVHAPDPLTRRTVSTHDRFRQVIGSARPAEERGVGERRERPSVSSSPPVVLSHIAARKGNGAVRCSRERLAADGHDPATAVAGTAGHHTTPGSPDAYRVHRPIFEANLGFPKSLAPQPVFTTFEDHVERGSALIGRPEQVIDTVQRYHDRFGHSVMHLHADAGGPTDAQHRESLEPFPSAIAPELRRTINDPPWPVPPLPVAKEQRA
ncbi:hypothetical protein [Cryptosporangium arvum]|uniref:hypothetical protein n=1 Tax=Cryptosporangium arvum TaxID=80871 RepID=UPI0004AC90B1|nr:hypothetical protein [Cryptosporangium arvum]